MKTVEAIKQYLNKFRHFSQEEIELRVNMFTIYSNLIASEENPNHGALTSKFIDYARQASQRLTYEILQADTMAEMNMRQYNALRDFEDYFYFNFEYSEKQYLKYYKSIEKQIDRAKIDNSQKHELHERASTSHENATAKISTLKKDLDSNYIRIVNSTKGVSRYM